MTAIPFTRGVPSADMLPVADLEAAAVTALREDGARALAYSPGGYMPLREWIGERHRVDPARVLLVNGSLQGVAFLAQHLFLGRGGVADHRGSHLRPHPDLAAHVRRRGGRRAR